jgi:nitrogen fixation protein NifX
MAKGDSEEMKEGDVLNDRMVKAAFATGDKLQVNAGFEQARQIVVYEVSTIGARECHAMTYRTAPPKEAGPSGTLGRNGKGGPGGGGGCNGGKKDEPIDEQEILAKAASLAGVSVLFVNRTLNAYSVLALNEAKVFTVKVDEQREIADVIVRLQEMLRGNPPLWLRRALIGEGAVIEEEPETLQRQEVHH